MAKIKWYIVFIIIFFAAGFFTASFSGKRAATSVRADIQSAKTRIQQLETSIQRANIYNRRIESELAEQRTLNQQLQNNNEQLESELGKQRELNKRLTDTITLSGESINRIDELVSTGSGIISSILKTTNP